MRSFLAIKLSEECKLKLIQVQSKINSQLSFPVKWIIKDNLHLTLFFMGNLNKASVPLLDHILTEVSQTHQSFELKLEGIGCFPNMQKPKVLWVGCENNKKLISLHNDIAEKLEKHNIAFDQKRFNPHLTLGRIKSAPQVNKLAELCMLLHASHTELVDKVCFFHSQLTYEGPIYTTLGEYHLKH